MNRPVSVEQAHSDDVGQVGIFFQKYGEHLCQGRYIPSLVYMHVTDGNLTMSNASGRGW